MRFYEFFLEYVIEIKSLKGTIPFNELPLYRKILILMIIVCSIVGGIIYPFSNSVMLFAPVVALLFIILLLIYIDSNKKNLQEMLENHYKPYSKKRIKMLTQLLEKYNISIWDTEKIDLLIEEAKVAQTQCDYLTLFDKPLKAFGALVIPISGYIANKVVGTATVDETINMAILAIVLILLIIAFFYALRSFIKMIIYKDYNLYEDLIYDLRQIKLFSKK